MRALVNAATNSLIALRTLVSAGSTATQNVRNCRGQGRMPWTRQGL
jgi:hypothetical protein